MPALEIANLFVEFPSSAGMVAAVEDVSLSVEEGEVLGIVGESGSGKTIAMLAVMRLVPELARVRARAIRIGGQDVLALTERAQRAVIGKEIAMIFQEPGTSLNPCFTVGFQIMETLRVHERMAGKAARKRTIELLDQVGIPAAGERLDAYPHQLSGGMNQRVMIAMAIACNPKVLIADEPTTALDVTIQAQVLELLLSLQRERGMALVLITHDMSVVADVAHRVAVMYGGQVMEERGATALFENPQHPYTAALLGARPESRIGDRLATIPGTVPSLTVRPRGCLFAPRCGFATPRSFDFRPELAAWIDGKVRCHYPLGDVTRETRIAADRTTGPAP